MKPLSSSEQILAEMLVAAFAAPELEMRFRQLCQKYPPAVIHRALRRARQVPAEKIRKSRVALFFFLAKTYAQHPIHHTSP